MNNITITPIESGRGIGLRAYTAQYKGCHLGVEIGVRTCWILNIATAMDRMRKGDASAMLEALVAYAARQGKAIAPGEWLSMGRKYLKPKLERMCAEAGVRVIQH